MNYPGHLIREGDPDASLVMALKEQLNAVLAAERNPQLRLDPTNPNFGPKMKQTIQYFQARNVDNQGRPLKQDGVIGPSTWAALFGDSPTVTNHAAPNAYLAEVLRVAAGEESKKVREVPRNSNRGAEVEAYLRSVGLAPGNPWCCAFVYWCFNEAAKAAGRTNPMVRTGGCLDHWNRAASVGAVRISAERAIDDPSLVRPGAIFIIDHGEGKGHTGLVESVDGEFMTTIEGNTDASKTREGGGVYRLTRRLNEVNTGFLDYSSC